MSDDAALVDRIRERARFSREETVRLISIAGTGHYASSFSCAEILATLYYGVMRLRRGEPRWPGRDRFLFGKGHAAAGLYPILADWGFLPEDVLDGYTRLGNPLGDHPDSTRVPGIEYSSGSLGHALSGGLGMALGARLSGRDFRVFVLLGDGECQEGQVWEAAMAAAHHGLDAVTAIVDRNGYCLDGRVEDVLDIEPLADKWRAFGWAVEEVDGHDVDQLLAALGPRRDRPTCVIAHTVKGKGVGFMEEHIGWHLGYLAPSDAERVLAELRAGGVSAPRTAAALHADSWQLLQLLDSAPGLHALSDALSDLVARDVPVVALTADLKYSNGLVRFAERHPERFVQCGIAEQNMVSLAAGLATTGHVPFAATFASFLALLCCEQIRTDVCYQQLPVRLVGHHAGIALGFYGTSHHATEDLAIMRSLANLTVVAPADPAQLRAAVLASARHEGPIYYRIARGREPAVYADDELDGFALGRAIELRRGQEATVIATGSMLHPSRAAVDALRARGRSVGLLDMHTIKPLDRDAVLRVAAASPLLVTVEEHTRLGGLGGAVAEVLADAGAPARLVRHGIDDVFSLIGPPTHLYAHYRLDAAGIETVVDEALAAHGGP